MLSNLKVILQKYEYSLLLKIWGACSVIFLVAGIIITPAAEFTLRQIINTQQDNYDFVFITMNKFHTNSFFFVGNSMEMTAENGQRLNSEILMQSNFSNYNEDGFRGHTRVLASNEAAISVNLARRANLSIGDYLTVRYPASQEDIYVVVVDYFGDAFGIRRPHEEGSVIIIGYIPLVAENTRDFISFVDESVVLGDDFVYFVQNQWMLEISEKMRGLWTQTITNLFIPIILMSLLQLIACVIFVVWNCMSYYHRLLLNGRRISLVKNEIRIDCIIVALPIIFVSLLVNATIVYFRFGSVFSLVSAVLLIFQCFTVILSYQLCLRKIALK